MKGLKYKMLQCCDLFIQLFRELRQETAAIPEKDERKMAKVFHYKFQNNAAAVKFTEIALLIEMVEEKDNE